MLPAVVAHHKTPTGLLLVVVIVLVLLYFALRTGRLGRLRSLAGATRVRTGMRAARVGPLSFLPLTVLVVVIVVLVVTH